MAIETRFQLTAQQDSERYAGLVERARQHVARRLALYQTLAHQTAATGAPRSVDVH